MNLNLSRILAAAACCLMLSSGACGAQERDFVDRVIQRFPAMAGAKIEPAFAGFWSVVKGNEVLFVRDDLSVLVAGEVIDLKSNQSISAALRAANKPHISTKDFDLKDAIRIGAGSRRLYVFSDPDCQYCRQLEPELAKLNDVQLYVFPFPLVSLHPNARSVAETIWCQRDPGAAWHSYVMGGAAPRTTTCDNPISRNLLLGERLQIQGTPALIFEDGTVIPGAISAERIEAQLVASARK